MVLEGGWKIVESKGRFTLYSPTGQKKGTFSKPEEAKKRMEQIRAIKRVKKKVVGKGAEKKKFFGKQK